MWVISYTFSSNPFTKPSSSPGPADSTNHCLPLSHMPNHISIHFSASSKPPPLGRLSSSAQSTGTTSSQAPPVYPSGCNQRDLSKVKWVQGLFFFKSLQMSYHWLWYFKALHYWSHLFSSASLLIQIHREHELYAFPHQNFPCYLNVSIPSHLCIFVLFLLEWHFISSLSRKLSYCKSHWWRISRGKNGASEIKGRVNFKKDVLDIGATQIHFSPSLSGNSNYSRVALAPSQWQEWHLIDLSLSNNPISLPCGWEISS